MLLKLAGSGVLKHVEVISTVSGGSIVGAAFYLRLLEHMSTSGGPLADSDMVGIVEGLAGSFPEKVRANVRVSAFSSYFRNVQMSQADYSRSDRVAELYEQLFFQGVLPGAASPVRMTDLQERLRRLPEGSPARGGMPALYINATSLNTGRDWRFSATTMGEAPLAGQAADIDRVVRFQRPSGYSDLLAPRPRNIPLSIAVAASSALPGGLHPMSISDMYEGLRIQLTDGGVHDNQGIESLIDADCSDFVVSDTGGQMTAEEQARTSLLAVLARAQQVLYGRVRQEQLFRTSERRPSTGAPSPLALIHLRKGVAVDLVRPRGPEGGGGGREPDPPPGGSSTTFGVDQRVMGLLADVRTDLDSFSEVERKSLMSSGYLVAGHTVADPMWTGSSFRSEQPAVVETDVLGLSEIGRYLAGPSMEYLRQLEIASHRVFKVFRLYRLLAILGGAIVLAAAATAVWGLVAFWSSGVPLGCLVGALTIVGLGLWVPTTTWGARALDAQAATVLRWIRNALITAPLAFVWANTYLLVFEPLFQRGGSVARLVMKGPPSPPGD